MNNRLLISLVVFLLTSRTLLSENTYRVNSADRVKEWEKEAACPDNRGYVYGPTLVYVNPRLPKPCRTPCCCASKAGCNVAFTKAQFAALATLACAMAIFIVIGNAPNPEGFSHFSLPE